MIFSILVGMTLAFPVGNHPVPEFVRDTQGIQLLPKRTQAQMRGLSKPLYIDKAVPATSVEDAITCLQDLTNQSEPVNLHDQQISILIDSEAFKRRHGDPHFRIEEDQHIVLPKSSGANLECLLHQVTQQFKGTFLIRHDHILITTWETAIGRPLRENEHITLVHWAAEKQPLSEILTGLSERYNQSIVISPEALKKTEQLVTARFLSTPLTEAVQSLAQMHGLKLVVKKNLYQIVIADPMSAIPKKTSKSPKNDDTSWYSSPTPSRKRTLTIPKDCSNVPINRAVVPPIEK